MAIQFKELGNTGVLIPEIGVGTWKYRGGPELLRRAVELGAAFIDTAEHYGNEEVVGQAIKGLRDRVFVATKTNHWRYCEVMRSAETSLRKLGIERIDLYQIHWPNAAVPIAETVSAMEDLVNQGKVHFIGISNFYVPEMKRAQAVVMHKDVIVSNQMSYSLAERTIERDVLPYCRSSQATIIAYSPLGSDFRKLLCADPGDVLGQVARMTNRTKAQVALNWCISRQGVVAIPKTESMEHLIENCGSSGWSLTEEQIALLNRGIRFGRRSRLEVALRRFARGTLQRMKTPRTIGQAVFRVRVV